MKKNYLKKSLSLIMAVLMLMSCWVWVVPTESEAVLGTVYGVPAVNGSHYNAGTTNAYNTPVFDGNTDRWFLWQNGDDWTKIYYPSQIYLDKSESLQAAGYYFNIQWHFGDGAKYRTFLGANIWGDHSQWSGYPERYYTMNNIFSNYAVDASLPDGYNGDGGLYGKNTGSSSNYDLRIVGYNHSGQGTDQFSYNDTTHTKYVSLRSRQTTNNATLYLMGNPNASYVGKTTEYNTSGNSFGGYGYAQKDGSTHKNGSNVYQGKGDDSSYREGDWIEMQWFVTVYDKSALNTLINNAATRAADLSYDRPSREALNTAITTARAVLTKRATNQTEIDNAKSALQSVYDSAKKRTYELTYENLFSLSDWWNSSSASKAGVTADITAGKVTVKNTNSSGEYVTPHSGSSASNGTRNTGNYAIPVKENTRYTLKYTTDHANTEMFAFFYDANGACTHAGSYGIYNFSVSNGTGERTITTPAGSAYMEIRFDNNTGATTANFSNIMIYEADRAEEIGLDSWTERPYRVVYNHGETLTAASVPTAARNGYKFDGWYFAADGSALSNSYNTLKFAGSYVVYSKWTANGMDLGYDNLFSVAEWYNAASEAGAKTNQGGAITADIENGSISISNPAGASSQDNNYVPWAYDIKVEPNTEYVFVFDADIQSSGMTNTNGANGVQFHLFENASADVTGSWIKFPSPEYLRTLGKTTGNTLTFTTSATTTNINVRLGTVDGYGVTNTFSNIGLFKKADYDAYIKNYAKIREAFEIGESKDLVIPTRAGYDFDGWFTEAGTKIENVSVLTESTIVYAQWTKLWTITFVDGNNEVVDKVTVRNGESATIPTAEPSKDTDDTYSYEFAGWSDGYENVTADATITPVFTQTEHGNFVYDEVPYSGATCESNAVVYKVCGNCSHRFAEATYYNPAEDANAASHKGWLAKGHSFNENDNTKILSTDDTYHVVKCSRNNCDETKQFEHTWTEDESKKVESTCSEKGSTTKTCHCGEKKITPVDENPNVHKNTTIVGASDATCEEDGYTGDTYCNDCKQTIATGTTEAKLGHSFKDEDYVSNNDATCTEDGTKTAKCERCDATDTIDDEGSALDHSFTKYESNNDATCTKDGTKTAKCDRCDATDTIDDEGSALNHSFTKYESNNDATCTKDGTKTAKCDRCDATDTIADEGSAKGHDYAVSANIQNNNNGTHSYLCANGCGTYGYEKTEGAGVACAYGAWNTTDAAQHSKTCADCGYVYSEDHTMSKWATTNAYNNAEGKHSRSCSVCGREEIEACDYDATNYPATCTTDEMTVYKCKNADCGHTYTVIGKEKLGHDYSKDAKSDGNGNHDFLCANGCGTRGFNGTTGAKTACVFDDFTNIESGKHTAKCTTCTYSKEVPCSGGEASCTAAAVCPDCNVAYGSTSDHKFEGDVVAIGGGVHAYLCVYCEKYQGVGTTLNGTEPCSGGNATCTALAVCGVCSKEYGTLEADDHKWSAWENVAGKEEHSRYCEYNNAHKETQACSGTAEVIAPDCKTEGYTLNTCATCDHTWETDPVEANGHAWGAWVDNDNGTHTRTCTIECGYADRVETVACSKENATADVTAPKCLEKGYTTYTCNACGYIWVDDYVDATGHSYNNHVKVLNDNYKRSSQSCTSDLTYWYRCDNCSVSAGTEEDKYDDVTKLYYVEAPATNHNYTKKIVTDEYLKDAATCTTAAVYYYACENCDAKSDKTYTNGDKLGHDWFATEAYPATPSDCITDATFYYECQREDCGISSKDVTGATWTKVDSKSGHKFGELTAAVEAECKKDGNVAYYTCETCKVNFAEDKETVLETVVIKELGHDDEKIPYKAPTCEENGNSEHSKCKRCGRETHYETYAATGHTFKASEGFYCDTVNNYHAYGCVNCDAFGVDSVKYTVEFDGLDYVITGGIPCEFSDEYVQYEDNGVHSHKKACVCGNVTGEACADAEPTYYEAVCGKDAYYVYVCDACAYEWTVTVEDSALTHEFGAWTSNGDGTHTRACVNGCDETETADCSTETPAVTCGQKNVCDTCNGEFGDAIAHTFTEYKYNEDAICTADGTKTAICDVCKVATDTITDEGSLKGHDMLDEFVYTTEGWANIPADFNKVIVAPTCKTEGLALNYCSRCDYYVTKIVKATGVHDWDENEDNWINMGGDCTSGVKFRIPCVNCDATMTKRVTIEHEYEVYSIESATCTDAGIITETCTVCGIIRTSAGEDALGHKNGDLVVEKAASCVAEGRAYYPCVRCGERTYESIPMTGHGWDLEGAIEGKDYNTVEAKDATCTAVGYSEHLVCLHCADGKLNYEEYAVKAHSDDDNDGKCDSCYGALYEKEDGSGTGTCGCICHRTSGFMKFIYKILNFFWKLFGIGQSCECGNVHYTK